MIDHAVTIHADLRIEVGPFAQQDVKFGKQPAHRLLVMPDVGTRSLATSDAFKSIKASILKPVRGGSGENARVHVRAVEEPVRKR